ncbi:MAG TPA: response regulator, partial [Oligoflexia bacterium]|nr:response regulator [Oligoflexia bacterium]
MEKSRILVIEDNQDTRQFLETVLSREFEVFSTQNAVAGIEYARTKQPDLIILDIMLPGGSGLELCREIRASSALPVIMLTALGADTDRIVGLEIGADDYLVKPF